MDRPGVEDWMVKGASEAALYRVIVEVHPITRPIHMPSPTWEGVTLRTCQHQARFDEWGRLEDSPVWCHCFDGEATNGP